MEGGEPRHEEGEDQEYPKAALARVNGPVEHLVRQPVTSSGVVVVAHVEEDVYDKVVYPQPRVLDFILGRDEELVHHLLIVRDT